MWQPWNDYKLKEISVNYKKKQLHLSLQEYTDPYLVEKIKKQYNFHLVEVIFYSSPFINVNNRKKMYKNKYSKGIHLGYIIDVEFGEKVQLNEVHLMIDKYNYKETEDILKNKEINKEEIEFIKKYIINHF